MAATNHETENKFEGGTDLVTTEATVGNATSDKDMLTAANGGTNDTGGDLDPSSGLKIYKKRWAILALFVLYSSSNAFQWTQLVIITNILEKYYQVSTFAISWTSLLYMVTYIPLIFPASWLLQKKGLRICVLLGSLGTCLGSWLKLCGTGRDQYPIVFAGQAIVAVSQIFILGMPSQLAATWFPSHQVSSACAIGVFGNQLGVALGFVIPVTVVQNREEPFVDQIGGDLFNMFLTVGIITTVIFGLIVFVFNDRPPTPPSHAQEVVLSGGKDQTSEKDAEKVEVVAEPSSFSDYAGSIKRLISNRGYILLLISYGLNVGVFYAISTLLNSVVVAHFVGAEEDAGRIGLLIVVCGMVGSMVCGIILDKTHQFKMTTLVIYFFSFIGMIVYTFTFRTGHIEVVYVTASALGFFMTGYLPVGFEFAAEITFPESEGTSSGLLNASAQIFGIVSTLVAERLLEVDDRVANGVLAGILLVGVIITAFIKQDYRRQAAMKQHQQETQDVMH